MTTPLPLGPNQPGDRPYRGGAGIARFRGTTQKSPFTPEDFVASTTEIFAGGGVGLTRLPDGRTLRESVAADPIRYLGEGRIIHNRANTMLLVKLLDTAERLFVHFHPDDTFAAAHLGSPRGKTEAWAIIDAAPGAYAALGFSRNVEMDEVLRWWEGQDADAMLGAMNQVPLESGDTVLVPAGLAHAIGPGVTLVELQQPTDLSILLERAGLSAAEALIGLDPATAFGGITRSVTDPETLGRLRSGRNDETLFPGEADRFFGAEHLRIRGNRELDPAFSVLVILEGDGTLVSQDSRISLHRGMTVLTAFGDGPLEVETTGIELIRCRPPR